MNQHNRVYVCLYAVLAVLRTTLSSIYNLLMYVLREVTRPLFKYLLKLHQTEQPQENVAQPDMTNKKQHAQLKYVVSSTLVLLITVFMFSHAFGLQIKISGGKTEDIQLEEITKEPSILLKEPTTGNELFKSAMLMTDYGRLDFAAE